MHRENYLERDRERETHTHIHTHTSLPPQGNRHQSIGVLHGHPLFSAASTALPRGPLGRGSPVCWSSLPCVHPGESDVLSQT